MDEEDIKQINSNLKKVGDDLKAFAEQSQKEIKRTGDMSAETKARVDELLTTQGELRARLEMAEQAIAEFDSAGNPGKPQTWGSQVAESDAFANFSGKGSFTVPVKGAITNISDPDLTRPERVPGIVVQPERRLTIRDLLMWSPTTSNAIEFVRETGFTNNAAPVSENPSSGKPESTLSYELDNAPVVTIAHWIHASKQVLSDAAMLRGQIDSRLRYGGKLVEEAQLLNGSGVGLNIDGLVTQATAYSNPGVTVDDETNIDRLRVAMLQVALAEYSADGIVLNPIDWAAIELTKDAENRYIFANALALAGPRLWGLPVVPTQSMAQGDFLTGAFGLGAHGWDREQQSVTVSTEDRDNFIKNMVTILWEERIALTVFRPEAFVTGELIAAS